MLREKERAYLELVRPRYLQKGKPKEERIRKRDNDIRKKAKKAIEYLTYLAENLIPDQHKQVFNEETVIPLIEAIFSDKHPEWKTETKESIVLDERLFRLAVTTSKLCLKKSDGLINLRVKQMIGEKGLNLFPQEKELELIKTIYTYPDLFKEVRAK